jgi:uncharacterized protein YcbX
MTGLGAVVALWRYPVKSMQGEACPALALDPRGVVGDRRFAVRDAQGKLGSGKDTRRFRNIQGLAAFQASYRNEIAQIQFPSGEILAADDPRLDGALSGALGQPVQLAREAEIKHQDAGALHLVTLDALATLRGHTPEDLADPRRFRPNLVLSTLAEWPAPAWLGKHLRIGDVELKVTALTERCAMVGFAQPDLPSAPQLLRHLTQAHGGCFGVYADVIRPGVLRHGDPVSELQ